MTAGYNQPEILFTHPGSPPTITDEPFFPPLDVLLSIRESSQQHEGVNAQSGAREPTYQRSLGAKDTEAIFEAINASVTIYDQTGRLQYANAAAQKLFAIPALASSSLDDPERARLLNIRDAAGNPLPHDRWALALLLRGEQAPVGQAGRILMRTPAGQDVLLQESGTPLYDDNGHIVGGVLISRVIKKRPGSSLAKLRATLKLMKQLHMNARQEAERLKQDIQALKEAEQLKDDFIATAAHELRSPLTTLIGYTEVLRQQTAASDGTELAEWQVEALETIAHDTLQVVSLANDLLDVTRLEAGQLELYCYSANLVHLIQRVVTRLQNSSKAHTLIVEAPRAPILVTIDTPRIEQVLHNLISNAIKYSPQGGQILVIVRERQDHRVAEIVVRDQGIGVPASQQDRIFSRFFRADNARIQGIEGTGLGLYLCRELVHLHGGHMGFASTEGQGSSFSFTLPLAPASDL